MTSDAVTVRYTPTPEDAIRGARAANQRTYRVVPALPIVGVLTMLSVVGLLWSYGDRSAIFWVVGVGLAASVLWLGFPLFTRWLVARRYPELFTTETVMTFDEAGFHASQAGASSDRAWARMTEFSDTSDFVVIREGRRPVAVIPKRAFSTTAERDALIQVLRAHIHSTT